MTVFVVLLRAINVGGSSSLAMKDLSALCRNLGFENVRTYIQSGNVIFESVLSEGEVKTAVEQALAVRMGKPVDVMCRTAAEMRSILDANPFPDAKPAQVAVVFFSEPVAEDVMEDVVIPGPEEIRIAGREIYIHYPDGMGRSKLKLPKAAAKGTARNINTVAKLAGMAGT